MPDAKRIQKVRRAQGKDRLPAELGKGSGQPRASKGRYWVRKKEAGGYSLPIELPLAPGMSILVKDGTPCEVGWDAKGRQVIYPAGGQELSTAGVNALTANPLDRVIYDPVRSTDFPPFLCKRHGNPVTHPLIVVVYVPPVILSGSIVLPTILHADLSGAVPSAGLKCYAVIFWLDDNSLEVQTSTPIGLDDPLNDTHLWEAIDASTPGSLPLWAWELADDQAVLTEEPTKNLDMRQFVNMPSSGGTTSFELAADTGTPAEIGDGETATIAGGIGIETSILANVVTINVVYEVIQDMIATFLAEGANIDISYNDAGNVLTIAVIGLDAADIGDFAEAVDDRVSALLVEGANIDLTYTDGSNTLTIAVTGLTASDISNFSEAVDDRVSALLVEGANIDLNYDDGANTLTIAVTGLTAAEISNFAEAVDDRVNALLVEGAGITLTYDDGTNTLTITNSGGTSPWQTTSNVVNLIASGDTVNVGGTANLAKLAVDGDADEVQLLVQGHTSQTSPLFVAEDSAGNDQVTISGDGAMVVNEEGNDADFRVESDGDANNIFSDGGNNNVGFGTGAPDASSKIHVVSTTKGSIASPVMTAAQVAAIGSPVEGLTAYESDTEHFDVYDGQRFRGLGKMGWTPYAYPLVFSPDAAFTTALALAANGGSIAIPMCVHAHMLFQNVSIRNTDASLVRAWSWNLYEQYLNNENSAENTLARVVAAAGDDSFTAAAASIRTVAAASSPVYLPPGVYWLVIQNRHATNTFGLGSTAVSAAFANNSAQTKTTSNPNGSTLDFVAATWTKVTAMYAVRMTGRVFGQSTTF